MNIELSKKILNSFLQVLIRKLNYLGVAQLK